MEKGHTIDLTDISLDKDAKKCEEIYLLFQYIPNGKYGEICRKAILNFQIH